MVTVDIQGDLGQCTIIFRAAVYLIALFYMFFGVSIVADRFMAAIEVITSQEREVKMKKITGEPYTILIRVWNETVSNLTLMALGESIDIQETEQKEIERKKEIWRAQ
ncbi:hypothetical protein TELCIR_19032 [Teladorsagia circumcincta]|uniref:Uncharacterized protein n=1 Tax=Teladorsagia circumcincta TaxID=45464 RepID=A0A2G9TNE1_TELCI|nr:hypothetical protein TELCIR_19032 [Teladorsagia circumcincta]